MHLKHSLLLFTLFSFLSLSQISQAEDTKPVIDTENFTNFEEVKVNQGETLSQICEDLELPAPQLFISKIKENKNFILREGQKIRIHKTLAPISELSFLEFPVSSKTSQFFLWQNSQWKSLEVSKNFETRIKKFSGIVKTSLWNSAEESQMDIKLLIKLSEVFAWVLDFSREIQAGDEWRLVATEYTYKGQHVGWKDVEAAEFKRGDQLYQAINYEDLESKRKGFFNSVGESLEKIFLKSPIKFGRITSRFTRKRFHPILQVNRPHLGIDYGAPVGTPIMAVGDGIVEFANWSGGGGRVLKIRHNSTFTTAYKHLSRFSKGISVGKKVHQGDIVAFSGSSGLSTGPHLHFEFLKNGSFIDPQSLKFPSATPLSSEEKQRFEEVMRKNVALLPQWPTESTVAFQKNEPSLNP
jgi:murein DD-endopeptidase MepM/ murein hydrolase activator NlpD